jgi:HK97 family phage portal protein
MIAPNSRILWLPGADERHWDFESGSFGGRGNAAGVRIDPETALRSTVVLACVRVLSSSVAGLPLHLYRRLPDGGKELARENPLYRVLHDTPNSWQTSYEWREQLMLHLLTHGQAFVEIGGAGEQTQLVVLHPSRMKVDRVENGRLRYTYREASGQSTVYAQDAIMMLRWLSDDGVNGLVPVELAKDAIGLSRACEIHGAAFFGNGARPGVVLSTDQMLSPETAENTRNQWERAHRGPDRAHRTAVLQGGLKVNELGGNNQEAQFLEARRFQVEEVCRIYGVPPHLVGDLSRSSYSNIEQQSLDYLQNGLMPWLRRIESAISRDLIADGDLFAEFDTRGALRADAAGRAAYYSQMATLGVLSVNDIRSAENMNPVEGGDERFVQLNMTTLTKAAAQPEPSPATVVEEIVMDEAAPAPEAVEVDAGPQIADVSLNGAQVSSLLEIVAQYNAGLLNEQGAKAIIAAAFPGVPPATVNAIIAGTSTTPVVMPERPGQRDAEPTVVAEAPPLETASRAAPGSVAEGDFVSWDSSGGRARGRIDHVMDYGTLDIPGTDFKIDATEEDPAALITLYEEVAGGWRATETQVGHKVATLTKIDPLPEPPAVEENAYGKPKQKPAKRDCGTGSGGFKPGNKCAPGGSGGGDSDGGSSGDGGGSDSGSSGGGGEATPEVKAWAEKKFDTQEQAEAFTKWFGDSKVVSESGEPLIVYHGTGSDFDEFKPSAKGMLGPGIYASADKGDYGPYSPYAGKDNARVVPLYMTIRNPHYAIAGDTKTFDAPPGHDGTILIDRRTKKILWAVAQTPTSVKSATGNSGTFDPDDPKITRSKRKGRKRG